MAFLSLRKLLFWHAIVLLFKNNVCQRKKKKRKIACSIFFGLLKDVFCLLLNFLLQEFRETFAILLSRFCRTQCIMSSKMTLGEIIFSLFL